MSLICPTISRCWRFCGSNTPPWPRDLSCNWRGQSAGRARGRASGPILRRPRLRWQPQPHRRQQARRLPAEVPGRLQLHRQRPARPASAEPLPQSHGRQSQPCPERGIAFGGSAADADLHRQSLAVEGLAARHPAASVGQEHADLSAPFAGPCARRGAGRRGLPRLSQLRAGRLGNLHLQRSAGPRGRPPPPAQAQPSLRRRRPLTNYRCGHHPPLSCVVPGACPASAARSYGVVPAVPMERPGQIHRVDDASTPSPPPSTRYA